MAADPLRFLSGDPRFQGRIAHIETLPEGDPEYGTLTEPLPDALDAYLNRKKIRLYTHQCEAIERLRAGKDIIITTPTASGKTLAFNLPIFEYLSSNPDATALYLYPAKALANDQYKAIVELEKFTGIEAGASVYDGDTPQGRRAAIRDRSRIVISNPYELHQILPWHAKWERFFRSLSFVVIDEAHRYRGVFGSHIAMLIRRLRRICRYYGSNPAFVFSTATIANPVEFAEALSGKKAAWIGNDGSPRRSKQFILYNPFSDGVQDRSVHRETADLFAAAVESGSRTLCFTGSRKMAELIARWSMDALAASGRSRQITAYRAGYLPEERRAIEDGLKDGTLSGVVSTNALELGIDIGSLDGVIISGYPGTMMSVWQQTGRAGRRAEKSFAILVGFANPLDQYFMRHPDAFFARSCEHAIVDTKNPYILSGQMLCAAAELPLHPENDAVWFGGDFSAVLASLESHHLLRRTSRGWAYAGRARAVETVDLSAISSETFRVLCSGRLLETMDRGQAYREAHQGAILLHRGETYCVMEMDTERHTIRVKETDVDYHTRPMVDTGVEVTETLESREIGGITVSFGAVEVTERTVGYTIQHRGAIVGTEPLDLPPILFSTRALWFTIPESVESAIRAEGFDFAGGLHGAEHALIATMPFFVMCDRWDIGGLSSSLHPAADGPVIFVYDGYEGGIGLAEKAYALLSDIAAMTLTLVSDCPCEAGCPACIHSPKCGNNNQPLDKRAAVMVLEAVARGLEGHR